jgi:Tol biopolymer transport system component
MRRRGTVLLGALALATALTPALARADVFEPISLASVSAIPGFAGNQQADFAHDAAISGDGRYVAFDGSYGGVTGVWRRDLQTGAVLSVASGNTAEPAINAPDAELPSISDDGRYVSFTTTTPLDPLDDTNTSPDVYVRDMSIPSSQPCEPGSECAYALASAVDGSSAGLSYAPPQGQSVESMQFYGSQAAGRSAISADGRKVAFVTTAISNLAGPATPALQVAMRDLDTDQTELVSVRADPSTGQPLPGQPVSGVQGSELFGAVFVGGTGASPIFKQPEPYEQPQPMFGASISADGTTVAWMGDDISEQARTLPGEALLAPYSEPLWRRVADGSAAPIRRVTGGGDPANPACAESNESVLPSTPSLSDPCQGPFSASQEGRRSGIFAGNIGDDVPRLSADGYSVVFLSNSPLAAIGQVFSGEEPKSDLYLVDMHEGLTRVQALRPLTELGSADQGDLSENAPIEDLGISPNGQQIAFTTKRTQFPLGSPAYISAPASIAGMLELFEVDLENDTLTRVTQGFEGGASEHPHEARAAGEDPYFKSGDGALSPSFSDDGRLTAFSSTASNLVFGDGNTPPIGANLFDGSDAFLVARKIFTPLPTPQAISPTPAGPALTPSWRLGVTARSRADGSLLLYVSVPGAGTVDAAARSAVRVRTRRRGHLSTSVATRNVASAKKPSQIGTGALLTLTLKLVPRYRALAGKRPGLAGSVNVTFTAAHHPTLKQTVRVSFLQTAKSKKQKSTAKKKANAKAAASEALPGTALRKESSR